MGMPEVFGTIINDCEISTPAYNQYGSRRTQDHLSGELGRQVPWEAHLDAAVGKCLDHRVDIGWAGACQAGEGVLKEQEMSGNKVEPPP